jgi:hypothetical protein
LFGLLSALSEGSCSPANVDRLQQLAAHHPEVHALYARFMMICSLLEWDGKAASLGEDRSSSQWWAVGEAKPEQRGNLRNQSPATTSPSTISYPLAFLQDLAGGALVTYAVAAMVLSVGLIAAWKWTMPAVRSPAAVAQTLAHRATSAEQAAKPEAAPVGAGKLPMPADRPAALSRAPAARGADRAAAGDGSQPRATMRIRSEGAKEVVVPLPIAGEAALPEVALFCIPTVELGGEYDFEIYDPPVYGTGVLRGKIKFWSNDGQSRDPILSEKIGPITVGRLMTRRALVTMCGRTGFGHNGQTVQGPKGSGADPRRPVAVPSNQGGFSFPWYVVTKAASAAELNSRKKSLGDSAGVDLPPLPAGTRYRSTVAFELASASPGAAELWCWYFTHNRLCAVRFNGTNLSLPKQPDDSSVGRLFEFRFRDGFVAGANSLEIAVDDPSPQAVAAPGPPRFFMALGGFWMAPRPGFAGEALRPPAATADGRPGNEVQPKDHAR